MASVTLRFYGRFVFGRSASTGKISVIAPVFDVAKHGRHDPLMSIRRDRLRFSEGAGKARVTTLHPTSKIVADAADPLQGETYVWDLTGQTVSYAVDGAVTFEERHAVADLVDLENRAGRPGKGIDPAALRPNPAGLTSAIVNVTAGAGVARSVVQPEPVYVFLTERDSRAGRSGTFLQHPNGGPLQLVLADVVDFAVTLPGTADALTLTFAPQSGEKATVTVLAGTIVNFTHICPTLPHLFRRDDLEFSQYYNLLQDRPGDLGYIPREPAPPLGEGSDCDLVAQAPIP